jgi:hypothetical protein
LIGYNSLKYIAIFTISIFLFSFSLVNQIQYVFAHSFSSNDSAYFLSLDKRTKVELELAEKNYPLNITLSMDHSDNAARLVYDIYYADDDIVEDTDFIKRYNKEINSSNSTTYALVVADLLDAVLKGYADALVIDTDLTNMSNLMLLDEMKKNLTQQSNSNNDSSMSSGNSDEDSTSESEASKLFSKNNPIFNYADYETAKALIVEIKDIFQNHLEPSSNVTNQSVDAIVKLERDLEKLSDLVNNNGIPSEVMQLVHLQIHPSLQAGFGLQTKMDMDGQMDMDAQMDMS